MAMLYLYLLNI